MKKTKKAFMVAIVIVAIVGIWGSIWYKRHYPYGAAHICNKAMILSLKMYANNHGGAYPTGESSPEASLSLLYREGVMREPDQLAGKAADPKVAKKILESGALLGPENCNWHYEEGLTEADPADVAVLWDKVPGLGHNCERIPDGGREVVLIGGNGSYIHGTNWSAFVEGQKIKLAELKERRMKESEQSAPGYRR